MAMAAVEEELTCPVCLDFYKDPLLLPCQHSLCKSCIVALRSNKGNAVDCVLQCPSCEHRFQAKDETCIESLPKNFALASIVCKFQESMKGNKGLPCDLCKKERAIKKCLQCQSNYCRMCLEQKHPKAEVQVNHMFVQIMGSNGDKREHEEYGQTRKVRYCMSCDEICVKGDKHSKYGNHEHHNTTDLQSALRQRKEEFESILGRLKEENKDLEKGVADISSKIETIQKKVEEKITALVQRYQQVTKEMGQRKMSAENRMKEEMKMRITSLEGHLHELKDLKQKTELRLSAFSKLSHFASDDAIIFLMKLKELQIEIGPVTGNYVKQGPIVTECDSSLPVEQLMDEIIANAICPLERRLQIPGTKPTNTDILPKHVEMAVKVTNVQKAGMMSADVEWSTIKQAGQYEISYSCSPNETVVLKKIVENRCKLTNLRWDSTYTIKVTTQLQDGSTVFDEDSFKTDPQVKCLQMAVSKICTEKVLLLNSFDGFKASNMVYNWSYFRKEGEFSGIIVTPFLTEDRSFWTMEVGLSIFEAGELKDIYLDFGIINYSNLMDNKCLTNNKAAYSCTVLRKKKSKFHLEFTNRLSTEVLSYPLPLKFHEKSIFSFGFLYDSVNCQFAVMDCQTQKVLHVFHDVIFDNDDTPVFAIYSSHTTRKMRVKIKFDYIHCTNEDISCWMQKIDEF